MNKDKEFVPPPGLRNVLLVNADDARTKTDRTCLRQFRIADPAVCASGVKAARHLLDNPTDLVICGGDLEDMSGLEFLRLVRTHPRLLTLPVVLVSSDNSRQAVLDAVAEGCSGYLIRPYSLQAFAKQVTGAFAGMSFRQEQAQALMQGEREISEKAFDQAIERFSQVVDEPDDAARELFDRGMRLLGARHYDAAIRCFQESVKANAQFAEAYVGLAKAWRGKGNKGEYRHYMAMAMDAYARQREFDKARHAFSEMLKSDPGAPNPFLAALPNQVKRGHFRQAALDCEKALMVAPDPDVVYMHVARACHFTSDPKTFAAEMARAMARTGAFPPSSSVYQRIMGRDEDLPARPKAQPRPMSKLGTVLAVAKYTFDAYRKGAETRKAS